MLVFKWIGFICSMVASSLHDLQFDPELGILYVWKFTCSCVWIGFSSFLQLPINMPVSPGLARMNRLCVNVCVCRLQIQNDPDYDEAIEWMVNIFIPSVKHVHLFVFSYQSVLLIIVDLDPIPGIGREVKLHLGCNTQLRKLLLFFLIIRLMSFIWAPSCSYCICVWCLQSCSTWIYLDPFLQEVLPKCAVFEKLWVLLHSYSVQSSLRACHVLQFIPHWNSNFLWKYSSRLLTELSTNDGEKKSTFFFFQWLLIELGRSIFKQRKVSAKARCFYVFILTFSNMFSCFTYR